MATWVPSEGLVIALCGGVSALLVSFCMCVLRSRCTRIKCCGCELERDVIAARDFAFVTTKANEKPSISS